MEKEYKLGDQIIFDSFYKRKSSYKLQGTYNRRFKEWEIQKYKTPQNGIVIGYRNLSNGFTDYEQEVGTMFTPTENFKAILVVFSMHRNAILVPIN